MRALPVGRCSGNIVSNIFGLSRADLGAKVPNAQPLRPVKYLKLLANWEGIHKLLLRIEINCYFLKKCPGSIWLGRNFALPGHRSKLKSQLAFIFFSWSENVLNKFPLLSPDTWAEKCLLMLKGGWAEGQACTELSLGIILNSLKYLIKVVTEKKTGADKRIILKYLKY